MLSAMAPASNWSCIAGKREADRDAPARETDVGSLVSHGTTFAVRLEKTMAGFRQMGINMACRGFPRRTAGNNPDCANPLVG